MTLPICTACKEAQVDDGGLQCQPCREGKRSKKPPVQQKVETTAPVEEPRTDASASFVILGAPRTKKNSGRIKWAPQKGRKVIVPSEAYEKWEAAALPQIAGRFRLMDGDYNCAAVFYRERRTGDLVGYQQALADVLEKAGVVRNDRQIAAWDGTRPDVDPENPRVEVTLTAVCGTDSGSPSTTGRAK